MRPLTPLVLGAALLAACGSPTAPGDQSEALARNRALWARKGPENYQIVMSRACECLPDATQPVTIIVRNGVVEGRQYLSGTAVDPQYEALFVSIPELFDLIQQAINENAPGIGVRYDAQLGYPESIQIDWVAGTADDEVSYRISDFGPISP